MNRYFIVIILYDKLR